MADSGHRRFVGPYRIVALIGVGASSTVYRAVRPSDHLQVAIKILADNHSMLAESRRRFSEEWKALAQFEHPAITTIFEIGETESGQPYIVLELANRGDLRNRVDHRTEEQYEITAADIDAVAQHLFVALSELHGKGVVHRDISPSNILIRSDHPGQRAPFGQSSGLLGVDERLLLTDLGFAKRLADASGLTRGGGTEGFAAPEQRNSVAIIDHRVDLYSATAVIDWIAYGTPSAGRLAEFVGVGLSPDPEDRFETIDQWYGEFRRALGGDDWGSGSVARGVGSTSGSGPVGSSSVPESSSYGLPVLLGVLLAGVIGLGAYLSVRSVDDGAADDQAAEVDAGDSSNDDDGGGDVAAPVTATPPASNASPPSDVDGSETPSTTSSVTATSALASTSSTPSSRPTTENPSSVSSNTAPSSTTSTAARSTTVNLFPNSPRAYIVSPTEDATVVGDLNVVGTATSPGGVAVVELVVKNLDDKTYWNPTALELGTEFFRFDVPVESAGAADVTWTYRIAGDRLPAGTYRIRSWAREVDGSGDPVGEVVIVTVADR